MFVTTKKRRGHGHPVEQTRRQKFLQWTGLLFLVLVTGFLVYKALTVNG